jgi:hypothetical protein
MPREMAYIRETCRDCRFYSWFERKGGRCHRYPPTVAGEIPQVAEADWCGEFKEQRKDQPNMWEGDVIEERKPGTDLEIRSSNWKHGSGR